MSSAQAMKFWDRIAPKYASDPIKDMASYETTLNKTRGYLEPSDRVLEIGAGTGSTALLLAENCSEIVATDISDKMLEVGRERAANEKVANVEFLQRTAEDMPEGPFDAILGHNILHLVEDLPSVLAAAHDRLKPGGLLISKTFLKPESGIHLEYRMMKIALPIMQAFGRAPFVGFYTGDQFEAMMTDAGFDIIESGHYPAGQLRRYVVARKV